MTANDPGVAGRKHNMKRSTFWGSFIALCAMILCLVPPVSAKFASMAVSGEYADYTPKAAYAEVPNLYLTGQTTGCTAGSAIVVHPIIRVIATWKNASHTALSGSNWIQNESSAGYSSNPAWSYLQANAALVDFQARCPAGTVYFSYHWRLGGEAHSTSCGVSSGLPPVDGPESADIHI